MTQIIKTLPRTAWEGVVIHENSDPLVELHETLQLTLGGVHKMYNPLFLVRQTVANKLYRVANHLPPSLRLVVIEGYRTMQHQQESWDRNYEKVKSDNLSWEHEQIEKAVGLVIARPHPLANHHCGGAIDVTLSYQNGELLDMGSPYPSEAYGSEIRELFPMFPNTVLHRRITSKQETNRKLLREAMEQQGFVWYPGEWWHYCYGDRMWAVYSERKECFYGPIEPQE